MVAVGDKVRIVADGTEGTVAYKDYLGYLHIRVSDGEGAFAHINDVEVI